LFLETSSFLFLKPLIEELGLRIINLESSIFSFPNYIKVNIYQSTNAFINKVAINGIYTLQAAIEARSKEKDRNYISDMGYSQKNIAKAFADFLNVDISSIDNRNPEKSLVKTTKYNKDIEEIKPNVVFIMMEALGTDLMHYNSESFNVLGEFKKHLDEDTVFYRF
ncbi:MAG: hypothetical protein II417_02610, partial [Elusimicrobia bacterium]|nr:hypothetical protein [Elusimicrobiota bacterium]